MGRTRKARTRPAARPFPKVGDFVVVGHRAWCEPDHWWISEVEWSDGRQFLVRDTNGWHPTHEAMLLDVEAIMAIGTKELCREVARAARDIRFRHVEAYRDANVALQMVRDQAVREIIDAVAAVGGVQASGCVATWSS